MVIKTTLESVFNAKQKKFEIKEVFYLYIIYRKKEFGGNMKRYFILALVLFFLILPIKKIFSAELRINYPNGGEKLTIGKYINIQWSSTGFPDTHRVKLELIRNGMYYGRIASSQKNLAPRVGQGQEVQRLMPSYLFEFGDCIEPRRLLEAIYDGADVAV